MSSSVSVPIIDKCANCGKGEENCSKLQKCGACLSVRYCSRECQAAHRPQHKKCKRRVAELYDEKLFADPPPREECPICFLPLPLEGKKSSFKSCCGKTVCNGCMYAMQMSAEGAYLCAFCREPNAVAAEEHIKRTKKLMDKGNGDAFYMFAGCYAKAEQGLPQDVQKCNELLLEAGELGCAQAYYNLGVHYNTGRGVEVDVNKAMHYWELAAMGGHIMARHNLGCIAGKAGKYDRAKKHYILAAKAGFEISLDQVKEGYMDGFVTKDEYASTLRAYQKSIGEMKSSARDIAEALPN